MQIPYIEINSDFLATLSPKMKEIVEKGLISHKRYEANIPVKKTTQSEIKKVKEQLKDSGRSYYFSTCPYCNNGGLFSTSFADSTSQPTTCVFCGETNPYYKIMQSLDKTKVLYQLSIFVESGDGDIVDEHATRVLQEQCLVTIATGIEVFLRDIYSLTLNLKYIKDEKTLYIRFYQDSRNEFINIGRAVKKFKKDLDIDLKIILEEDTLKKLNLLMLKRNVIVHNIGLIDKTFLEQSGLQYELKTPVPISPEEIDAYFSVIEVVVQGIIESFNQEFRTAMLRRMESFFKRI